MSSQADLTNTVTQVRNLLITHQFTPESAATLIQRVGVRPIVILANHYGILVGTRNPIDILLDVNEHLYP
jgi:hypothetical protein